MKLKTLFFSSSPIKHIPVLLDSLANKGYDYSFVGIGVHYYGFGTKVNCIQEYIDNYLDRSYTHVLVLDAYDVIMLKKEEILLSEYKYNFTDKDMVFAAEPLCYPDVNLIDFYPKVTEVEFFRYLNSGCFIAPLDKIKNRAKLASKADDQRNYTRIYLDSTDITLDHKCKLFQCLNAVPESIFKINFDMIRLRNTLVNTQTNTEPCILHGNGKFNMNHYIKELI